MIYIHRCLHKYIYVYIHINTNIYLYIYGYIPKYIFILTNLGQWWWRAFPI